MASIPLHFVRPPAAASKTSAAEFRAEMARRRSVRDFSSDPIPDGVLDDCIAAAASAPSGANLQPWHFSVVESPAVKREIRLAAEREEREFYASRAPEDWLEALSPLGTDANKPFLETAPALVVIFQKNSVHLPDGSAGKTYYPKESVGIATGILIAALHRSGLATLTHTPSPMGFLNTALARPAEEKPFLLLVVGYPSAGCTVPDIERKPLSQVSSHH